MCRTRSFLVFFGLLLSPHAWADLPVVDDTGWPALRDHCRQLLRALDKTKTSVPAETIRQLQSILDKKSRDPQAAVRAVQKLLDPHCLLAVSINPESRVKAARGPAVIDLHQNQETVVLIKVHNEGGVTHTLHLSGPEIIDAEKRDEQRWLQADLVTEAPFGAELRGRRLEYRLLRLTPRQSGKREATFQFDVGQGTQDLGFRAETPILFTVRKAARRK
jgi:hypothetical protein